MSTCTCNQIFTCQFCLCNSIVLTMIRICRTMSRERSLTTIKKGRLIISHNILQYHIFLKYCYLKLKHIHNYLCFIRSTSCTVWNSHFPMKSVYLLQNCSVSWNKIDHITLSNLHKVTSKFESLFQIIYPTSYNQAI